MIMIKYVQIKQFIYFRPCRLSSLLPSSLQSLHPLSYHPSSRRPRLRRHPHLPVLSAAVRKLPVPASCSLGSTPPSSTSAPPGRHSPLLSAPPRAPSPPPSWSPRRSCPRSPLCSSPCCTRASRAHSSPRSPASSWRLPLH